MPFAMARLPFLFAPALLLLVACGERPAAAAPTACARLDAMAGAVGDAAPALAACLSTRPAGGALALRPGTYQLLSPIRIERPVTLRTQGLATGAPACRPVDPRCAMLVIGQQRIPPGTDNIMPIMVTAANVTFDHLIVAGTRDRDPRYDRRICGTGGLRPLGGGIRVLSTGFTLNRSVIRDTTCYTAIEVVSGVAGLRLIDNIIGPNGDHRPGEIWSDGATIHDAERAVVTGNLFTDNTDVQLIFGGCRECRVSNNRFRHGTAFRNGAFAELMIHAWPTTSGRYDGTVVTGNDIDCGAARNCGFGLIVGARPWYKAPTSGGAVHGNRIRNARVGLNVDGITGPVDIRDNVVATSGGTFGASCGVRRWRPINIAPSARRFLPPPMQAVPGGQDSADCRPNTTPEP